MGDLPTHDQVSIELGRKAMVRRGSNGASASVGVEIVGEVREVVRGVVGEELVVALREERDALAAEVARLREVVAKEGGDG